MVYTHVDGQTSVLKYNCKIPVTINSFGVLHCYHKEICEANVFGTLLAPCMWAGTLFSGSFFPLGA